MVIGGLQAHSISHTGQIYCILRHKHIAWCCFGSKLLFYEGGTYVCVRSLQSCLTLGNTIDCSPSGSPDHGILQGGILEWVAMPSSRRSSQPQDWTCVSRVTVSLYHWATGKPLNGGQVSKTSCSLYGWWYIWQMIFLCIIYPRFSAVSHMLFLLKGRVNNISIYPSNFGTIWELRKESKISFTADKDRE